MRRISLVGVFMLVMLALATHVSSARADTENTITQTAITSPSDPSYFYDSTGGALGSFTVTGTTDSTDPANDQVDIDCFSDDGSSGSLNYTVVTTGLNSDGSFTVTVPYAAMETYEYAYPGQSACRLRALPAGSTQTAGLSSFSGPRVLVSYLTLGYEGSNLNNYSLVAPQLGATNVYDEASDCGLAAAFLADPTVFGQLDAQSFSCADSTSNLQVDGNGASPDGNGAVSASQDPVNGDMTISETEPLASCLSSTCPAETGVEQDRTIRQAANGHVVEITDVFRSTDGSSHSLSLLLTTEPCFQAATCYPWSENYDPPQISYQFPGETSPSPHVNGDFEAVDDSAPATINVQSGTADVSGAITYFTAPSDDFSFSIGSYDTDPGNPDNQTIYYSNDLNAPYTLTVPAGGSVSLSYAYSSESSPEGLAADVQTARDLQSLPTVTFATPASGATISTASATVTGQVSATTGVSGVTVNGVNATLNGSSYSATVPLEAGANTLTAVVTANSGVTASATETITYALPSTTTTTPQTPVTPAVQANWTGPVWLPIADTGTAKRAGARKEKLSGRVTAGSGSVTYYFEYGTHGNLAHHTASVELAASESSHQVAFTVGGLSRGAKYTYRLVASGSYGHAAGRSRSFKTAHKK